VSWDLGGERKKFCDAMCGGGGTALPLPSSSWWLISRAMMRNGFPFGAPGLERTFLFPFSFLVPADSYRHGMECDALFPRTVPVPVYQYQCWFCSHTDVELPVSWRCRWRARPAAAVRLILTPFTCRLSMHRADLDGVWDKPVKKE
jgi:hypothetical protein